MKIDIGPISQKDLAGQICLSRSVYSREIPKDLDPSDALGTDHLFDETHLLWKHVNNSGGPSICVSPLTEKNKLIGRSITHPRQLNMWDGSKFSAATITDLVISPDHRNINSLVNLIRSQKCIDGVDAFLHSSNEKSDSIYRNLFRFPIAFSLSSFALPIRLSGFFRKRGIKKVLLLNAGDFITWPWRIFLLGMLQVISLMSDLRITTATSTVDQEKILKDCMKNFGTHLSRNISFLNWRFKNGTKFTGNINWIGNADGPIGYMVTQKVMLGGLSFFVIMDFGISRELRKRDALFLILTVAEMAIKGKCDAVFTMVNQAHPLLRNLTTFPMIRISDSKLPHPTPIYAYFSDASRKFSSDISSCYFTLADLDYF